MKVIAAASAFLSSFCLFSSSWNPVCPDVKETTYFFFLSSSSLSWGLGERRVLVGWERVSLYCPGYPELTLAQKCWIKGLCHHAQPYLLFQRQASNGLWPCLLPRQSWLLFGLEDWAPDAKSFQSDRKSLLNTCQSWKTKFPKLSRVFTDSLFLHLYFRTWEIYTERLLQRYLPLVCQSLFIFNRYVNFPPRTSCHSRHNFITF